MVYRCFHSAFPISATAICLSVTAFLSVTALPARAETEMQRKIAEVQRRLEAERKMPDAQRWALDDRHLDELEAKAAAGDAQASQFLELAQLRLKKVRRERLQKAWGRVLNLPDAPAELKTHALRMAELRRIRFLAVSRHYPKLAQRATELLQQERERHARRMQEIAAELRGGAASAPGSADAPEALTAPARAEVAR